MTDPLYTRVLASFVGSFDAAPAVVMRAPGRVNLIGEHTDYNDGFVLPCAIGFHTLVAAAAARGPRVRVVAADLGHAVDEFRIDAPIQPHPKAGWANHVRGVFAMLAADGVPLQGLNLAIAGDVPRGAGLSSSAALEVAVARAAQHLLGLHELQPGDIARLAQRAENQFVGCQCGIMDPLVSALGQAGHALLLDCRSLQARPVAVPDDIAVMVVHSHVRRGLVDSEYNLRRQQCQAAAAHLGRASLRDADPAALVAAQATMDPVAWRRARHVLGENERTLGAAAALAHGDLAGLGRLMAASHESMRDDFEITVPAVDRLVQVLQQAIGPDGGARMTGGGFGGCVVALLPAARVEAVRQQVLDNYRTPDGRPCTVWVTRPCAGAGPTFA